MGDLFGDWVPDEWIEQVLETVRTIHLHPWHTYIFLTKNPKRYQAFNPWPETCWLGATVTNRADANERIPELLKAQATVRFVSVEPMLGPVDFTCYWGLPFEREGSSILMGHSLLRRIQWLIIGAMTGPGAEAHQPKPEWVQSLIDLTCSAGVPLFLKDNLKWPDKLQEYP
jgi:protein gp37